MATAPTTATSDPAAPTVGIVIVNYRTPALTIECLAALANERSDFSTFHAIAADGGSADGSAEQISAAIADRGWEGWATPLPLAINGGFAYANNRAIAALCDRADRPDFIALINPDARVLPGALTIMARRLLAEPGAGAVGALLVHEDGRPQGSAFHWPTIRGEFARATHTRAIERLLRVPDVAVTANSAQCVDWVTGAAVMFRTAALAEAGLFDDGFFLYFEETELMHRLAAKGWSIWHEPAARVVHHAGAATQFRDPATGRARSRRMPRYWYDSRCRYFALTGGRWRAVLAAIATVAGRCLWQVRQTLTGRPDVAAAHTSRDTLAYSLWPSRAQLTPHLRELGGAIPARPAWMEP